jgi:hypothetical protein
MVVAKHQERRCADIETAILNMRAQSYPEKLELNSETLDDNARQALAFMQLADESKALPLLLRYKSEHNRCYHRAMRQLIALRSKGVFDRPAETRNEPTTAPKPNTAKQQTKTGSPTPNVKPTAGPRPAANEDARPNVFTQAA